MYEPYILQCVVRPQYAFLQRAYDDYRTNSTPCRRGVTNQCAVRMSIALGRSGFIPFDARKGCFAESFTRNFIAINLSQYPESLLESELFGHKKGAFTGAIENHEGIFSRCTPHGSIFLDEIGDVSVPVQIKLLQVLQERHFVPLGSHEAKRFKGRVIAATNRPLAELRDGRMRDDFYYRLCSDVIEVPALRQRIAESAGELEQLVARPATEPDDVRGAGGDRGGLAVVLGPGSIGPVLDRRAVPRQREEAPLAVGGRDPVHPVAPRRPRIERDDPRPEGLRVRGGHDDLRAVSLLPDAAVEPHPRLPGRRGHDRRDAAMICHAEPSHRVDAVETGIRRKARQQRRFEPVGFK